MEEGKVITNRRQPSTTPRPRTKPVAYGRTHYADDATIAYRRERTCVWTPVRSNYKTSCGHYLESYNGFGDSDIGDMGDYCRYCGGKIKVTE